MLFAIAEPLPAPAAASHPRSHVCSIPLAKVTPIPAPTFRRGHLLRLSALVADDAPEPYSGTPLLGFHSDLTHDIIVCRFAYMPEGLPQTF